MNRLPSTQAFSEQRTAFGSIHECFTATHQQPLDLSASSSQYDNHQAGQTHVYIVEEECKITTRIKLCVKEYQRALLGIVLCVMGIGIDRGAAT